MLLNIIFVITHETKNCVGQGLSKLKGVEMNEVLKICPSQFDQTLNIIFQIL